jgi:hypothetical protein
MAVPALPQLVGRHVEMAREQHRLEQLAPQRFVVWPARWLR